MKKLFEPAVAVSASCLFALSACLHQAPPQDSLRIVGYSDENFAFLDRRIASRVCVQGELVISTHGVYFPLAPIERDGVIEPGAARILSGLSYSAAMDKGLRHGAVHEICGTVQDATPFRNCTDNSCRWYKLVGPVVVSGRNT